MVRTLVGLLAVFAMNIILYLILHVANTVSTTDFVKNIAIMEDLV